MQRIASVFKAFCLGEIEGSAGFKEGIGKKENHMAAGGTPRPFFKVQRALFFFKIATGHVSADCLQGSDDKGLRLEKHALAFLSLRRPHQVVDAHPCGLTAAKETLPACL